MAPVAGCFAMGFRSGVEKGWCRQLLARALIQKIGQKSKQAQESGTLSRILFK
jgi:hypothetical protein